MQIFFGVISTNESRSMYSMARSRRHHGVRCQADARIAVRGAHVGQLLHFDQKKRKGVGRKNRCTNRIMDATLFASFLSYSFWAIIPRGRNEKETDLKTIRGHFDGNVVILDEPAPVDHAAEVRVEFPEVLESEPLQQKRVFHWQQRVPTDTFEGSVADEVIRQRRME